jgi:hypothetical protein
MTRILAIFCVGAAALMMVACDGVGRKYPPGYTDDGVKFKEDGWRYYPSDKRAMISYEPVTGEEHVRFRCDLPDNNSSLGELLDLDRLEISTAEFEPLQQWPQPPIGVLIGQTQASELATLLPQQNGNPDMSITIDGRTRDQLLAGIRRGLPVTLSFADQKREIPGPPQSMREAFADKCRGER